ncbi:MAG TPA: hypothetical protein VES66_11510 [Terriglobales bacterium]|nr:hypothetical protein [Terriglobales bacterium]
MSIKEEVVSEKTLGKVLSMLPDYPTVEQLMETGEFDSNNTIHAALRVLEKQGKVQPRDLFGYGTEAEDKEK